ncbi:hypothetical protein [Yinghuangia sp. YIM S09857]|uniref:hypothetical protein n=1 Tax=Yinghuangia sp. YIM S09857 TaxID=3436929 RepID=UPI003F53D8E1
MDLNAVTDELYALTPGEFTAARNARAAEAVHAGDRPLGERIRALPKPTLAAWASNLLVRTRPDETGPLLELGEALREAYRNVDGAQLRTLSARRNQVTAALAREARQLAAAAGQPIGDQAQQEVQDTLHAALADADAAQAWASGQLSRPLEAAGFPAIDPSAAKGRAPRTGGAGAGASSPRGIRSDQADQAGGTADGAGPARGCGSGRKRQAAPGTASPDTAADLDSARARREQRARAESARQALREAEQACQAAERSRTGHQERLDRATAHQERAARRAADLAARLTTAQDELHDAEASVRDARADLKAAERTVREAETRVRRARRESESADRRASGSDGGKAGKAGKSGDA